MIVIEKQLSTLKAQLCTYLYKNKKKRFSVGGTYYSDTGERDVFIEFLSNKLKQNIGISDIFSKCQELYSLHNSIIENFIYYLDDCFDDKLIVNGAQLYYKIKNYNL